MNLPKSPSRLMRLMTLGSVFVAIFAGSACSRDTQPITTSTDRVLDPVDNEQYTTLLEGAGEQVESNDSEPPLDDSNDQGVMSEPSEGADKFQTELKDLQAMVHTQLEEILSLYRRLHIELDDDRRSAMIVDLFHDPRLEIRTLGFELTDRDLSSNTVLSPGVSEAAKKMLEDPNPEIRSKAARLITRLVPPDAMIVLTQSLKNESNPIAAEPMLMGIARWPNPEAVEAVLAWFVRDDAPFAAVCSAAWSIEESGFWDPSTQHPVLLTKLRSVDPKQLHEAGMKLIARIGDASDLRLLLSLLLAEDQTQQHWAANALVETPRAVELLVQAAEENDHLFRAASDSLIRHRATPEGLRRLVTLPYPNEQERTEAIVRMGNALENDRLAEAVRLAGLDSSQTVLLLNRLLNGNIELSARVAKGITLLAQTELDEVRPNRAFEAAIALDNASLDPAERVKIDSIKAIALILLGKMNEAYALSTDVSLWFESMDRTRDAELRKRIASFMVGSFRKVLNDNQRGMLARAVEPSSPPAAKPPANDEVNKSSNEPGAAEGSKPEQPEG